ncbi:hypothetical protein SNE40_009352 [Patella caerulea]|uniref:Calponin-homology (CH) domain-containing protein n=1 Tax=Patella caerulea TaxID=87958 RepID=A0AAN8Q341_PATCE
MDRAQLCLSLIKWLNTFKVTVPNQTVEDLSDGIAVAQALREIAPDYFNDAWFKKLKVEESLNWRLKVSNLKKVLNGILEYNIEVLGIQIQGFQMPDVNLIGERHDSVETSRLLQLVLGCAVRCSEKQFHIQNIMKMEESVQQMIMNAIQELMSKEIQSAPEVDSEIVEQLKKTVEELNAALENKEELLQRCHELDMQVATYLEEKNSLQTENERLVDRLHQAESLDDPSTPAGKRLQKLQSQMEQMQEQLYHVEQARDDYRIKFEVATKDYQELKDKNAELAPLAKEALALKDELDCLRHAADQAAKYESSIESYKKKIEEITVLRSQNKTLGEQITKYIQEKIEMEEAVKRFDSVKQQLEWFQRQNHELQNKLSEEIKRADKVEFEHKKSQEKMVLLQREKERVVAERDSLSELNEELKCMQTPNVSNVSNLDSMASTPTEMEMKEKLLRLAHENKMLKMSTTSEEESEPLQFALEKTNARKNELETDVRLLNQRILELEAQVEVLQENQTPVDDGSAEVKKKLLQKEQQIESCNRQLEENNQQNKAMAQTLEEKQQKITQLETDFANKEKEMKMLETKYKKYLDKARHIIKIMDPRQSSSSETDALKSQLLDRQRYVEYLERDLAKAKAVIDHEEKIAVSAWYNLGFQLHRQATEQRLSSSSSGGQSFLARQRHVQSRRPASVSALLPNNNSTSSEH